MTRARLTAPCAIGIENMPVLGGNALHDRASARLVPHRAAAVGSAVPRITNSVRFRLEAYSITRAASTIERARITAARMMNRGGGYWLLRQARRGAGRRRARLFLCHRCGLVICGH
jgi:hypothetical protein